MRLALLMATVACGLAQQRIDIHPVTGGASDRLKEAERRWRIAQHSSWRDASTSEEVAVAGAATKFYNELFQPELRSPPRITTLTERGQDILIGKWAVSGGQSSFLELIVWDTPQGTSFIFRLPPSRWSSDPAIRLSFERLLLPARSDGKTPPTKGVT
jgi:hypothetical protein